MAVLVLGLCVSGAFAQECRAPAAPDPGTAAILGRLARSGLAEDMACGDRPYAAHALLDSLDGSPGRRYSWRNGPNRGYVASTREYRRAGAACRDFTLAVYRHGREFDRRGTACRRLGGDWEF